MSGTPKAATRFCFNCWHGSCDSCNSGACDCWCCPKEMIGPPQFARENGYLCAPAPRTQEDSRG